MKTQCHKRNGHMVSRRRKVSGVSLIEIMVSLVLGIVVIGALVVMYTSGNAANRTTQVQGQMNEDAQMALQSLAQELRNAGFNPIRDPVAGTVNDLGLANWTLRACDSEFTDPSEALPVNLSCKGTGSPALAIAYEGDKYSGPMDTTNTKLLDCIGNGVTATVAGGNTFYVMQSRLYIEGNALMCRGGADLTQSQILAENIESISLSFAVADPAAAINTTTVAYVTASEVEAPADLLKWNNLAIDKRWKKITAARICVVAVSQEAVSSDLGSGQTYRACDGSDVAIADNKMRRAYSTTVLLRNNGVGAL
jgi:type IV pilus assembly protein PilW